jgi:predicted transcriptional regulator
MIDFACKRFDLNDIIKCGLSLTKTEFEIMNFFIENPRSEHITSEIAKKLKLSLPTIQKAVKKLYEKKVILRHQKNLQNGGYVYTYESNTKVNIRKILQEIIKNWSKAVEDKLEKW